MISEYVKNKTTISYLANHTDVTNEKVLQLDITLILKDLHPVY